MTFKEKVLLIVKQIPAGTTMTYKQVAIWAGNAKASRAVGAILKTNYDRTIPCHRVICSNGSIGGYNRGQENKAALLRQEKFLVD